MRLLAAILLAVGCLGGAATAYAETSPPSPPSPPTVWVEGAAKVGISKAATPAEAQAAYHQAFAAALASGQEKAEFVAGEVNAKVASTEQIVPRGGSVNCFVSGEEGTLREYEPYDGASPNFVTVQLLGGYVTEALSSAAKPTAHKTPKKKKKKHKHHAKKAVAATCELSANVVVSYLLT